MRGEFVDVGGARLYYYAAGSRGAGEPVIFLHGFPTSSHLWRDVVPLVPSGHRVVVVDLLGYGRSDMPAAHPLGIAAHGERVVALLDALGIDDAAIVGHDLGGGVAQWLAASHPARVSRLCLVDVVAFSAWPAIRMRLARAMIPIARHLPPTWFLSALRTELLRGYAEHERGVRSIEIYFRPFAEGEGRRALWAHLEALDNAETTALDGQLRTLVQPTAVVWGQDDPFLPLALAHRLHQTIPGATLHLVPGARHFTPEDAPQQVGIALTSLLDR